VDIFVSSIISRSKRCLILWGRARALFEEDILENVALLAISEKMDVDGLSFMSSFSMLHAFRISDSACHLKPFSFFKILV